MCGRHRQARETTTPQHFLLQGRASRHPALPHPSPLLVVCHTKALFWCFASFVGRAVVLLLLLNFRFSFGCLGKPDGGGGRRGGGVKQGDDEQEEDEGKRKEPANNNNHESTPPTSQQQPTKPTNQASKQASSKQASSLGLFGFFLTLGCQSAVFPPPNRPARMKPRQNRTTVGFALLAWQNSEIRWLIRLLILKISSRHTGSVHRRLIFQSFEFVRVCMARAPANSPQPRSKHTQRRGAQHADFFNQAARGSYSESSTRNVSIPVK